MIILTDRVHRKGECTSRLRLCGKPFSLTPVFDADGMTDADNGEISQYWLHDRIHDCCKKYLEEKDVLTLWR